MATSADIGKYLPDGTLLVSHVSGDGYVCGVGAILLTNYNTEADQQARDLWQSHGACMEEFTEDRAYWLDPEEYGGDWTCDLDYLTYLWKDGQWFYRDWEADGEPLLPLDKAAVIRDAHEYFDQQAVDRIQAFLDSNGRYDGQ